MTTWYRDFSEYSTGELGSVGSADFTVYEGNATWLETVTTDAGATGGQTLVVSNNGQGSAVTSAILGAAATSGDCEVYARIKIGNVAGDSEYLLGPALSDSTRANYQLYLPSTTTVRLVRVSNSGGLAAYVDAAQSFSPTADTYFKIRIGRSGTTIRAKIWADGDGEPGTWNAGSGTDTTLTTIGASLSFFGYVIMPVTVDVFGAATAGDTAPTTASGGSTVTPTVGDIRVAGQTPTVSRTTVGEALPDTGTLRFVGQTPTVAYIANVSVSPSVGTLRFVGQQLPLFDTSALVDFDTPAKNLLTGADQQEFRVLVRKNGTTAPTVDIDLYENGSWVADLVTGTSVTSDTGQIVSATWNAALLSDISGAGVQCFIYGHSSADAQVEIGAVEWVAELEAVQTPTVGVLRFAGAAPSVAYTDHVTVTPSAGTYRVEGQQPSVTSSAAQTVAPSVGTLVFVGQQPTATVSEPGLASPQVGTIRFVGQQPSVGYTHSVDPLQGVLRLEGAYPSVTVTEYQWASPSTGVVRTVGQTPTAAITANIWVAPVAGALRFDGQQPSLVEGGDKSASPESGVLRFVGNAPAVTLPTDRVGGDDLPPGWNKRRARLKLNRELEYTEQIREIYRALTGSPQAAEAEAILAPVVPPIAATGESEDARAAAIEARAEALRVRADRLDYDAVQAEIALRLLYQQWRQQMEDDDVAAMEILLGHVL